MHQMALAPGSDLPGADPLLQTQAYVVSPGLIHSTTRSRSSERRSALVAVQRPWNARETGTCGREPAPVDRLGSSAAAPTHHRRSRPCGVSVPDRRPTGRGVGLPCTSVGAHPYASRCRRGHADLRKELDSGQLVLDPSSPMRRPPASRPKQHGGFSPVVTTLRRTRTTMTRVDTTAPTASVYHGPERVVRLHGA